MRIIEAKSKMGTSFADAISIEMTDTHDGVGYERFLLEKKYPSYKLLKQSFIEKDGKFYDVLDIALPNDKKTSVYFDISNFYGKYTHS